MAFGQARLALRTPGEPECSNVRGKWSTPLSQQIALQHHQKDQKRGYVRRVSAKTGLEAICRTDPANLSSFSRYSWLRTTARAG
ncbi:hypothetical protein WJX75_002284 [Coccomyxa subellipsoidea]|uniref:Uncharacterized protein n=1 Tax=Coccomyxa subellipsoidea TaxID=248742 RepID=A0ABR2YJ62_9CHLO